MPSNNTISQVEVNGTTYDLLDANTLSAVSALNTRVSQLENSVAKKTDIKVNNLGANPHGSLANDTTQKWLSLGSGTCFIGGQTTHGQPYEWGHVFSSVYNNWEIGQLFIPCDGQTSKTIYYRTVNGGTEQMPDWSLRFGTSRTTLLNWGAYNSRDTVLWLNDNYKKYPFITIICGYSTGQTSGGCSYIQTIPTSFLSTGTQIECSYMLNGQNQYGTLVINGDTSVKLAGVNSGFTLREIDGVY